MLTLFLTSSTNRAVIHAGAVMGDLVVKCYFVDVAVAVITFVTIGVSRIGARIGVFRVPHFFPRLLRNGNHLATAAHATAAKGSCLFRGVFKGYVEAQRSAVVKCGFYDGKTRVCFVKFHTFPFCPDFPPGSAYWLISLPIPKSMRMLLRLFLLLILLWLLFLLFL